MVIDMAVKAARGSVRVFALDTGRLPDETYLTAERVADEVRRRDRVVLPAHGAVEKLTRTKGLYSFRDSLDNRHECCGIRKVEPLGRALAPLDAWMTGLRNEQSVTRTDTPEVEIDRATAGWSSEPARALDDGGRSRLRRSSTASRSTRCTIAATRRSAAPPAPAPSRPANIRAPAAGGGRIPRTRSAGSTSRRPPEAVPAGSLGVTPWKTNRWAAGPDDPATSRSPCTCERDRRPVLTSPSRFPHR